MIRVAALSANLGAYDAPMAWTEQRLPSGASLSVHRFTDETLPPRSKAMMSALQCGLVKWFGPEFVPPADVYLWVDASCALLADDCIARWLAHLTFPVCSEEYGRSLLANGVELVVFQHPDRSTIRQEYDFIKARLAKAGEKYLTKRYAGEWLDEQYATIARDRAFVDRQLFATTAFMYRPTPRVLAAFKEIWFGKTRWHLHDQLWFAYVIGKSDIPIHVLPDRYTACDYLTYVRNWKRKAAA